MDTAVYGYGDKLYLNITNKCHLDCTFCIRRNQAGLGDAPSLWLAEEPTVQQVLEAVQARGTDGVAQIVFCGYGEPTERLHDMLTMAKELKKMPHCPPLRLDTNGLSSLVYGYDTVPDIAERFDAVSISTRPRRRSMRPCALPHGGRKPFLPCWILPATCGPWCGIPG